MSNKKTSRKRTKDLGVGYVDIHFGRRFIFPIKPGAKFPPLIKDNLEQASSDPAQLEAWEKQWPGCNWGVAHRKSGLLVADVDTNAKKGKQGQKTYDGLDLVYGWPETEMTTTPSGGFHKIYEGWANDEHPEHIMALGVNGIGKDIDSPNYTLIPGCTFDDGTGYVGNGADAVRCPAWVYDEIAKNRGARRNSIDNPTDLAVDLDKDENIDLAIDYLKNDAKPSIQGSGGDEALRNTAYQLRDMGISVERGAELLNNYYDMQPAWDYDDLIKKMQGAYKYAKQEQPGGNTAEADFKDDKAEPFEPTNKKAADEKAAEISTKGRTRAINKIKKLRKVNEANKSAPEEIAKARKDEAKWIERYSLTDDDINGTSGTEMSEGSSAEWFDIIQNFVYIGSDERFFDKRSRKFWRTTAFDKFYSSVSVMDRRPGTSLSAHVFLNELMPMYKGVTYRPDGPTAINGNFNMWLRSDIEPVQGDTSKLDEHFAYLFPDEAARNRVLNWLAWVYQNQGLKPRHALLIHGEIAGTGKSFIGYLMARVLGRYLPNGVLSGTFTIKGKTLDAAHNGWEQQNKFVIVEEVRPGFGSSQSAVKGLHDLISEDHVNMDRKNMDPEMIALYLAFLLFSNKLDALALDNSDRRYEIETVDPVPGSVKLTPKSASYYRELYDLIKDPGAMAAFAWALQNRDLGEYSGLSAAPMTNIKTVMADETRDDLERWFDENTGKRPLRYSLVALQEVIEFVPNDLRRPGWIKRVTNLLRDKLKAVNIGEVRFGGSKDPKHRLWSINGRITRAANSDKQLADIFRTEHERLTPEEKQAAARALAEVRREFADDMTVEEIM